MCPHGSLTYGRTDADELRSSTFVLAPDSLRAVCLLTEPLRSQRGSLPLPEIVRAFPIPQLELYTVLARPRSPMKLRRHARLTVSIVDPSTYRSGKIFTACQYEDQFQVLQTRTAPSPCTNTLPSIPNHAQSPCSSPRRAARTRGRLPQRRRRCGSLKNEPTWPACGLACFFQPTAGLL